MEIINLKNEHGENMAIKIENGKVLVKHEDISDDFLSLDYLFLNKNISNEELAMIYESVNPMCKEMKTK